MGVPHLYRHLCRRVPSMVVRDPAHLPARIHHVYVDFNGAVHGAVNDLIDRGERVTDESVIAASLAYLESVVERFRPSDLLFVAVDGVPPRAKMLQQMWRRHEHLQESNEKAKNAKGGGPGAGWDKNAITPGTPFMARLDDALLAWSDSGRTVANVVVSASSAPGEGEQKMFHHMHAHRQRRDRAMDADQETNALLLGLDADLLLMAMCELDDRESAYSRMYIVREQDAAGDCKGACSIVDVGALNRGVGRDLMRGRRDGVTDFVALVALAGNDFVPSLPSVQIRSGGIDHILRIYHEEAGDDPLWGVGGSALLEGLNLTFLQRIVQRVASSEGVALANQGRTRDRRDPGGAPPDRIRPMEPAWRARYYAHTFGCSESELVLHLSRQYVAMVAWSASYMIRKRCLSLGVICAHGHAAPLALDVANALGDADIDIRCRELFERADALDELARKHARASGSEWHRIQVLPQQRLPASSPASHLFPNRLAEARKLPIRDAQLVSLHFRAAAERTM